MGYRRKDGPPPFAMRSGSSPRSAASMTAPKPSCGTIRIWSPAPLTACTPLPIRSAAPQTGHDHAQTRKLLAALARHPNAGAVLVLSLGCENLTHDQFLAELGEYDPDRVKFLTCQDVEDELVAGREILKELAAYAAQFRREPIPASELVIGMKCGGSDGLSGITANPTIGRFSDMLCARGGSTVLTEVPGCSVPRAS